MTHDSLFWDDLAKDLKGEDEADFVRQSLRIQAIDDVVNALRVGAKAPAPLDC